MLHLRSGFRLLSWCAMHRTSPRVTDRLLRLSVGLPLRDRRTEISSIELDTNPENTPVHYRPIGFV